MLNIFPQTLCSGDAIPLKLTLVHKSDGSPYDLTGATLSLTVKPQPEDSDDHQAPFMQDVTGDSTGLVNFIITSLPAGTYWMDIKMLTSGQRTTIIPPVQMKLIQSVTTRA
jgi:hypothetical protein